MPTLADRLGVPRHTATHARYGATGLIRAIGTGLFYPFSLIYFHHQLGAPLVQIGLCLTIAGLVGAGPAWSTQAGWWTDSALAT